MKQERYTFQAFTKRFPDNSSCLEHLFATLYPKAKCPKCEEVGKYHRQDDTAHYVCQCGGHQISPKSGTIFEKSSTDLQKWFFAMFLMTSAKNGVSAKELERQLGVTYKCAYRIHKQIRSLMKQSGGLKGTVEADETYIGGKRKGKRGRGAAGKTAVMGIHERGGKVYAKAIPNVRRVTVMPLIRENVEIGTNLMTDELASYATATKEGYKHATVRHSAGEYARGDVTTNTIEGFWSQLKRSIDGTHHSVSPKHLQTYLDERAWIWNRRTSELHPFHLLLSEVSA